MILNLERLLGTISYVFAAFAGMMIVGCRLPAKKCFWLRVVISSVVICLFRYLLLVEIIPLLGDTIGSSGMIVLATVNLSVTVLCALAVGFCHKANLWAILFCTSAGYSMQFITHEIYKFLPLFGFSPTKWEETMLLALITAVPYFLIWYFYFRRTNHVGMYQEHKLQIVITFVSVFVSVYLNWFFEQAAQETGSMELQVYRAVFAILTILMAFIMECGFLEEKNMQSERDELKRMIEEQREKYLQEKKNIDLVNIRCHDIRHQLWELNDSIDPEAMKKITDCIDVYDSKMETGNEAISVVLAKYGLYCAKHHIRLSCMIDGEKLRFIPAHELYSLFGNAIENAVNAVKKLDYEKRVISVTEQITGNLMNITFTNYFSGELELENGLPVNHAENHGYGVKSIRMIAEEYGGRVNVQTMGDLFMMNVFFPLPVSAGLEQVSAN